MECYVDLGLLRVDSLLIHGFVGILVLVWFCCLLLVSCLVFNRLLWFCGVGLRIRISRCFELVCGWIFVVLRGLRFVLWVLQWCYWLLGLRLFRLVSCFCPTLFVYEWCLTVDFGLIVLCCLCRFG